MNRPPEDIPGYQSWPHPKPQPVDAPAATGECDCPENYFAGTDWLVEHDEDCIVGILEMAP